MTKSEKVVVDLIDFTLEILRKWKLITVIVIVSAGLSVAIALSIPKVYQTSVTLTLPKEFEVKHIAERLGVETTKEDLFYEFYSNARSRQVLEKFLNSTGYGARLFPNSKNEEELAILIDAFISEVQLRILEPKAEKGTFVYRPDIFELSMNHTDEKLLVELNNAYVIYVNKILKESKVLARKLEVESELALVEREIAIKRENAKVKRLLKIEKLESENQQKVALLQQEKELLINLADSNNETKVNSRAESNRISMLELLRDRKLELETARKDRLNQIMSTKEALSVAKSLGIEYPAELEDLSPTKSNDVSTNISVNNDVSKPLYLMGTKYLETLISVLENRESDVPFVEDLNRIDKEIAQIEQDVELEALKQRKSAAPFLAELNSLDKQIFAIENDKVIENLKNRKSDDPYIEELPSLLEKKETLESLPLELRDIDFYSATKLARSNHKAVKPNRPAIAILGTLLGGIVAFMVAAISIMINIKFQKKQRI